MKSNRPTKTKLKDRVTEASRYIGTFIIILSGVILYADKIVDYLDIQITYQFKYYGSLDVFLWTLSGTISPLLLVLGFWLKPFKWALSAPLTAYSIQLMYILRDEAIIHKDYFWYYTLAFMLGFVLLAWLLRNYQDAVAKLKDKILFVMHKIVIDSVDEGHVVNVAKWDESIVEPVMKKLDE